MIKQRFYITEYDWYVTILYNTDTTDIKYILYLLKKICSEKDILLELKCNLIKGKYNTGYTYSNYNIRSSITLIGISTSAEQTINTIVHEAYRIQSHIADVFNFNKDGEESCYLIGYIVQIMYGFIKNKL